MKTYVLPKKINYDSLQKYLEVAHDTNQFTNGGWAVSELEERARQMLKIDDGKAVIATSSGSTALHAMLYGMERQMDMRLRIATQDFTFASNSQGPATGPIITDIDANCNMNLADEYALEYANLYIITNCFGHVQDLDSILQFCQSNKKLLILDNAASPYSFFNGTNTCNYGTGSYVSLHHTKPIGFGEGGLAIIDRHFENSVRIAINFGLIEGQFNERGNNFKMSEISAAAILQYWDSFNIDELKEKLLDTYYQTSYKIKSEYEGVDFPNFSDDDEFLPSCYPFIFNEHTLAQEFDEDCKKYYHPLRGLPISTEIYNRIINFPLGENDD
jgi:dTDP-4-amino-4,6-dideoxygalactose transaminase